VVVGFGQNRENRVRVSAFLGLALTLWCGTAEQLIDYFQREGDIERRKIDPNFAQTDLDEYAALAASIMSMSSSSRNANIGSWEESFD
jgi:hypothetical protein